MMKAKLVVASVALLATVACSGAAATEREPEDSCVSGTVAEVVEVAGNQSAIISKSQSSIRFRPGYAYRAVRKGNKTIMTISDPNIAGSGGSVECNCFSHGTGSSPAGCFPAVEGNTVVCKSNGCTQSCVIQVIALPPPPPGSG